jgi:hypothetical protein
MPYLRSSIVSAAALLAALHISAQNVVTDWNTVASTTIVTNAAIPIAASGVWFAYTSIAVYDAVNAVRHRPFQPFYYSGPTRPGASEEAAAAAAAHRVLVNYFPGQQAALDAQYQVAMNAITADSRAKTHGTEVGEAAAAALISERTGDGLLAPVPYTPGSGPGVWQPTPPAFLPAATPWLGQMRPFTMRSAGQFLPDGPTSLSSEEWVADYNLTRLFGDASSTLRTPAQSEIGLFWTVNTAQQYAKTFNNLVQHYNLDVMDSARLAAILWTGFADTGIGCFNAKYTYNFWRPITAIRAGGDNGDLVADANWAPLAATSNHPEYPAAHACLSSAVSTLIADFFGTHKVHVVVESTAFSDGTHTPTFESTEDWLNEVYWARIFGGFHFSYSLQAGKMLGKQVADQLFANHFGRENHSGR